MHTTTVPPPGVYWTILYWLEACLRIRQCCSKCLIDSELCHDAYWLPCYFKLPGAECGIAIHPEKWLRVFFLERFPIPRRTSTVTVTHPFHNHGHSSPHLSEASSLTPSTALAIQGPTPLSGWCPSGLYGLEWENNAVLGYARVRPANVPR
jgi:hypothetical protein